MWRFRGLFCAVLILTSTASAAQEREVVRDNHFGCRDREYFDKLHRFVVQGDKDAFTIGLGAGIAAGQCTMFQRGELLFLSDTAVFSGLLKVRRRGEMVDYWMLSEATH